MQIAVSSFKIFHWWRMAVGIIFLCMAVWKVCDCVHALRSADGWFLVYVVNDRSARYFYSAPQWSHCAPQCDHCKRCTSYGNSVCLSVCLSVTRRYCVKTTARSTVQFALSDSKMCRFIETKNIPQGRPLPPEILAPSDLPPPDSS